MGSKSRSRPLGTRGQLLIWCAVVWAMVGVGVLAGQSTEDPALFHTHLPVWIRIGGWWITAALGAYGALTHRHLRLAVAALMVMPLQRVLSYGWAELMAIIPAAPPGLPGAWYSMVFHGFMVAVVLIAANVHEPVVGDRRPRKDEPWTGQ